LEVDEDLNLPPTEISALYELYNATGGENWHWSNMSGNPWNFQPSCNPCTERWQGVLCVPGDISVGDNYQYVYQLTLPAMNLVGSIPDCVGEFKQMIYLSLSSNHLTGSIPDALSNAASLMALDLSTNSLNSTLPVTWPAYQTLWHSSWPTMS
jgi:hypothetical protein